MYKKINYMYTIDYDSVNMQGWLQRLIHLKTKFYKNVNLTVFNALLQC